MDAFNLKGMQISAAESLHPLSRRPLLGDRLMADMCVMLVDLAAAPVMLENAWKRVFRQGYLS